VIKVVFGHIGWDCTRNKEFVREPISKKELKKTIEKIDVLDDQLDKLIPEFNDPKYSNLILASREINRLKRNVYRLENSWYLKRARAILYVEFNVAYTWWLLTQLYPQMRKNKQFYVAFSKLRELRKQFGLKKTELYKNK
jgi:hypothetical protein